MSEDKPFVRRWSERKSAHRAGQALPDKEKPEPPPPARENETTHASPPAPPDETGVPDEMPVPKDLPSIESLTLDSDYAPFLRADVPATLRKAALRKLWTSDPVMARMDPLDLHNVDYTWPAVKEVVTSLFQAGRGMVLPEDEIAKVEAEKIAAKPAAEAPALPAAAPEATVKIESADAAPVIADGRGEKEPG